MSRAWSAVSVLVSVASLGVALWALDEAKRAREPAPVPARSSPAETPGPGHGPGSASPSVAEGGLPSSAPTSSASIDGSVAPPEAAPEEDPLRALVLRTVKEELDAREREREGKTPEKAEGRKPPLSQVVAELDLDQGQKEAVHAAVLRGQEETIALLRTPTGGGRVPLDDLLKVLMGPAEGQRERIVEVFGMLATEKVPGSEETYAQRVEELKRSTSEAFRRSFSPEQFKAYEKTGQDPLEIQIPDSPWIQVLQEAWKKTR